MRFYTINQDHDGAEELIEALSKPMKPGRIIPLSLDAFDCMRHWTDGYDIPSIDEPDTWSDRLKAEAKELETRLGKLDAFTDTPAFEALQVPDRTHLVEQAKVMHEYLDILHLRLNRTT